LSLAINDLADSDHKAALDIGRELREWRERAGLSQDEAAERLGLASGNTVSRWETGLRRPRGVDYKQAIALYGQLADERQSRTVPRGTAHTLREAASPYAADVDLPRQFQIMAKEFEVEALKLGAEEPEMDYIRMALASPETARMFAYGYRSREGVSEAALKADYEALINALRTYVKARVKGRAEAKRRG
jgi:transcriptional regulator with XRE-family HTH domain